MGPNPGLLPTSTTSKDVFVDGTDQPPSQAPPSRNGLCFRDFLADVSRWYWTPENWYRLNDEQRTLVDQWRRHESRWRYLTALVCYLGSPSNTLGNVWLPLASVLALCVMCKLLDPSLTKHWATEQESVILKLYGASSFALSMLLAFRINRTYDRWWLARTAFGQVSGGVVRLVRQVATFTDGAALIRQYQKWGMCCAYAAMQCINGAERVTDTRVPLLLDVDELALYNAARKPPKLCVGMLTSLTVHVGFDSAIAQPMLLDTVQGLSKAIGKLSCLKKQAMPSGMALFCTGWTYIWLLLLPFGVYPQSTWWGLMPISIAACMMLGLEDLSIQLEDPFKFFAYEAILESAAREIVPCVQETSACRELVRNTFADARLKPGVREGQALPPWPELKAAPQYD